MPEHQPSEDLPAKEGVDLVECSTKAEQSRTEEGYESDSCLLPAEEQQQQKFQRRYSKFWKGSDKSRIIKTVILSCFILVLWLIAHRHGDMLADRMKTALHNVPSIEVDWHNPRANTNSSKLALLIEPRALGSLVPFLLHMMVVTPPDWPFTFIGNNASLEQVLAAPAILDKIKSGRLAVLQADPIFRLENDEDVSRMMTDTRFYDQVIPGVEHLFYFTSNSILCANSEHSVDDFLAYDWIGASSTAFGGIGAAMPANAGGISLRRVSALRHVLSNQERTNDTEGEDDFFFRRVASLPEAQIATEEVSSTFGASERWANEPMSYLWNGDLQAEFWEDENYRQVVWDYCPEIKMVMDMKLQIEKCEDEHTES